MASPSVNEGNTGRSGSRTRRIFNRHALPDEIKDIVMPRPNL